MKKLPLNFCFSPQFIKQADVKILYDTLGTSMPVLHYDCKHFWCFNASQLDTACQNLKINGYIFDCELTNKGRQGKDGCLSWRSKYVEGGIRLNMLQYNDHLIYIKNLNTLFKQFECGIAGSVNVVLIIPSDWTTL